MGQISSTAQMQGWFIQHQKIQLNGRAFLFIVTQSIKKLSDVMKQAVFNDYGYRLLSNDDPVTIGGLMTSTGLIRIIGVSTTTVPIKLFLLTQQLIWD